ncbi:hypothetical protein [Aestuariispira insulae]|uniref:RiboL-PSP-HEPN domain-containing protein n=1 Tax=Aestuariispira insulae TaxID=1461337 RepID=A0A3D9HRZ6_9PROT|nr:hypothetical protein [Aestuariispira insulae]RED52240.1 hypothetical protein DFP90_102258 [Aestuariispira insulae]
MIETIIYCSTATAASTTLSSDRDVSVYSSVQTPSFWHIGIKHLPDEFLREIGAVVAAHGQLEYMLKLIIKRLKDPEIKGNFADDMTKLHKKKRMSELKAAVLDAFTDDVNGSKLGRLINKCLEKIVPTEGTEHKGLSDWRNIIVHGRWSFVRSVEKVTCEHACEHYELSPADLRSLANKIDEVVHDLQNLIPPK